MRYGIILTTGRPTELAQLAAAAEAAGWDGVFYWDGIAVGQVETFDPWVVMAAMAMATSRIRLGAIVTPPARRRPWKLARETMTLDHLSNGRLILPVGLGATDDAAFGNVGEPASARVRAELLDESLDVLEGLWSGEPFSYDGAHYRFEAMTFRPPPIQARIPIWVVGAWPSKRSMRRTLKYDGVVAQVESAQLLREMAGWVAEQRTAAGETRAFEIVAQGTTSGGNAAGLVRPWKEAGATWWVEAAWEAPSVDSLRARIVAGPPVVD